MTDNLPRTLPSNDNENNEFRHTFTPRSRLKLCMFLFSFLSFFSFFCFVFVFGGGGGGGSLSVACDGDWRRWSDPSHGQPLNMRGIDDYKLGNVDDPEMWRCTVGALMRLFGAPKFDLSGSGRGLVGVYERCSQPDLPHAPSPRPVVVHWNHGSAAPLFFPRPVWILSNQ